MDSLLTIGVSNAAAVAVLAVLLIPLARWLRRPALTHAVCVLLLLKLVTPPLFTFSLHWLPSDQAANTEAITVPAAEGTTAATTETAATGPADDWVELDEAAVDEPTSDLPAAPTPAVLQPVPLALSRPPAPFPWAFALAIAWLAAAMLCTVLIVVRLFGLRRFLKSAVIAPSDVQAHAR